MDLTDTLWLCFICAGLTCIRTILFQRFQGRRLRSKLNAQCYHNECKRPITNIDSSACGSAPLVSADAAICRTARDGATCNTSAEDNASDEDNASAKKGCSALSSLMASSGACGPCGLLCDSAACSEAGSTCSSRSSSQGDSDEESDCRCTSSSTAYSDYERQTMKQDYRSSGNVLTPLAKPHVICPIGPLRPAIRLPTSVSTPRSTSTDEACGKRKGKSVTFRAGGAVICSPPTVEALSLLAAGTPPLRVSPLTCSAICCSGGSSIASSSADDGSSAHLKCSEGALVCDVHSPALLHMTSGPTQLACSLQASQSSSPVLHVASALPFTGIIPGPDASLLVADAAHASALTRAASGRQRVMAALEEARSRHSHLGRSPSRHCGSGGRSASSNLHSLCIDERCCAALKVGGLQLGSELRLSGPGLLARLPNLPLAHKDLEILLVGYVAPCNAVCAAEGGAVAAIREGGTGPCAPCEEAGSPACDAKGTGVKAVSSSSGLRVEDRYVETVRLRPAARLDIEILNQLGCAARLRIAEEVAKQSDQLFYSKV